LNNASYVAYNNKGIILKAMGRLDAAIEAFENATSLNAGDVCAVCNLAFLLKDIDENENALNYYNSAAEIAFSSEQIHLNIGLLLCRLNNYQEASLHFMKAKNLIQTDQSKSKVSILDIGYKVSYLITVGFEVDIVNVISVEKVFELSLLKNIPQVESIASKESKDYIFASSEPSDNIIKGLIENNNKARHRKGQKLDRSGVWFIAHVENIGSTVAVFNINNEKYYNIVIKEIQRKIKPIFEKVNCLEHSKVDNVELTTLLTTAQDTQQKIEVSFENRLHREVYFNINFNGYYLSGITTGSIKSIYPYLLTEKDLSMTICLTCVGDDGISRKFIIDSVKRININERW
jgi:tetratricopeptide (TPR) repeat protein